MVTRQDETRINAMLNSLRNGIPHSHPHQYHHPHPTVPDPAKTHPRADPHPQTKHSNLPASFHLHAPIKMLASPTSLVASVEAACIKQHLTTGASCDAGAYNWRCGPNAYNFDIDQLCKDTYGQTAYADAQGGGCYDWG